LQRLGAVGFFKERVLQKKEPMIRKLAWLGVFLVTIGGYAADLESRALTHYVPQNDLEAIVRKDGWTEIVLKPFGGVRKGDFARIWSGGVIDRGGGDYPGQVADAPTGVNGSKLGVNPAKLAISPDPRHAFALLFKTEEGVAHPCAAQGKPLEVKFTKDGARLWIGFNDEKGRFIDNHLGKGRRHELDPLWVRIEVIRIVVD